MCLEWLMLVGCCLASAWLFYDEEPVLDLTDLGFLQSMCLLFALLSVFWENIGRAGAGFYASRDRQLGLWAVTFFVGMDAYFKLIAFGFFLHSLVPLWVDQVESTSLYAYLLGSYWVTGTQVMGFLGLALLLLHASARIPSWLPLLVLLGGGWGWMLGDVVTSSLTSSTNAGAAQRVTPYSFTPSACTYETRMGGAEFEWHKASVFPNTFFFLDAASFFYALLLVISVGVLLYVTCMGILGYHMGGYTFFSWTHRAVLIRLLEHSIVCVGAGMLMVVGVGWRVGFEHYTLTF